MKKYSFLVILALLFTACGESVEEQARRYIDRANQAFQTENYSEAKQLIDSVKILFPKAFRLHCCQSQPCRSLPLHFLNGKSKQQLQLL